MRPLSGILQRSFGLGGVPDLNYAEITFNPPYTPEDVYQMEAAAAAKWGFDGVHLAITDHDEFAGSLALLRGRPDLNGRIAIERRAVTLVPGALISPGSERPARERKSRKRTLEFKRLRGVDATTNCLKPSPPAAAWSS